MPGTVPTTPSKSPAVSWVIVLAILGAAMSSAEILSGSMMPLMAEGLNTSEGMIGQAVTATAIVAIITSLSIGRISGNHDRRMLLIVLTMFLITSNIGVMLAPNVWVMLGARLFLGAAIGIIWGLLPAIVLRLAPPGHFARSFALVVTGVSIAGVLGAPLAAFVGAAVSWRVVYLGATVLAVLALVMLIVSFPALPARPGTLQRDVRGTIGLPGMVTGMIGVMLIFGGGQTFFGYMVPFLEEITGLSASMVSITLLLTGISGLVSTLLAPRTLAVNIRGVLVGAALLMSVMLGLLQFAGQFVIPTILILMVWTFGRSHNGVGANAWIAHTFPEHVEGAGGVLVAVIQGSMMLGAILGGVLIDNVGAKAPPAAAAVILAAGAIYGIRAFRPLPAIPEEPLVLATIESPEISLSEEIA